jgi:hypothetical protein
LGKLGNPYRFLPIAPRLGREILVFFGIFAEEPRTRSVRSSVTGASDMSNNSPAKNFRIGLINASVFRNVIEPREAGGAEKDDS